MDIGFKIISFFGFMVAITMHEAAHAFMAEFLGDKSPSTKERATINPIPHIDLFGTILFPLLMIMVPTQIPIVFGWAKPVFFNAASFKNPKRDLNLVAVAGPGANFLIAIICGIIARVLGVENVVFTAPHINVAVNPGIAMLLSITISNFVIGIFNFLPFPGSDGWRLLVNSVNYNLSRKLEQYSFYISMIMLFLLVMGVLNFIIVPCLFLFNNLLNLVG